MAASKRKRKSKATAGGESGENGVTHREGYRNNRAATVWQRSASAYQAYRRKRQRNIKAWRGGIISWHQQRNGGSWRHLARRRLRGVSESAGGKAAIAKASS